METLLRRAGPLLWIGVLVLWLLHCLHFRLIVDDSFIAFRYADHLASGDGLVFNTGERVEGYTSLLWVLLLAACRLLGLDLATAATVLGIASATGGLLVVHRLARRLGADPAPATMAPLLLVANGSWAMWAGAGSEMPLFAALLALAVLLHLERGFSGRVAATLIVATLARPEGAMVAAVLALHSIVRRDPAQRVGWRWMLAYGLGIVALLAWRHGYYGEWLPNTHAVKVAGIGATMVERGAHYLIGYAREFGGLYGFVLLPLVLGAGRAVLPDRERRDVALVVVLVALWCAYVAWVGGDFMPYFRLLVPILPLVSVLAAVALSVVAAGAGSAERWRRRLAVSAGVLALAVSLIPSFAGERRVFREWREVEEFRVGVGNWMKQHARAGSVLALNPAGIVPYVSGLETIDMLGLTDSHIARHGRRDPTLTVGHQAGDGAYVLSRRPDYVILGSLAPDDCFNRADDPYGCTPVYVGDRELAAAEEFRRLYEPLRVNDGAFRFGLFRRRPSP